MPAIKINDLKDLEPIINRAQVCRIGFCKDDLPYVVPMNFGYRDGCVYLHSSPTGKKMDILKANGNVCFEVDVDHVIKSSETACLWGMRFRSVLGFGHAVVVEDAAEKVAALDTIMEHYSGGGSHEYSSEMVGAVAIIKIVLEEVAGRINGYEEA